MTGDDTFDADEITHLDEREVVDEVAEVLAIEGPPDDAREVTPRAQAICRECGGDVQRLVETWPAPASAEEAWQNWSACCVVVGRARVWSFCRFTGGCWDGGARFDFERRVAPKAPPWDGRERRRPTTTPETT